MGYRTISGTWIRSSHQPDVSVLSRVTQCVSGQSWTNSSFTQMSKFAFNSTWTIVTVKEILKRSGALLNTISPLERPNRLCSAYRILCSRLIIKESLRARRKKSKSLYSTWMRYSLNSKSSGKSHIMLRKNDDRHFWTQALHSGSLEFNHLNKRKLVKRM
jgi:hypothetical protein